MARALIVSAVACAVLLPPLMTGLEAIVPTGVAIAVGLSLAAIAVAWLAKRVPQIPRGMRFAVWIAVALLAVVQSARISLFMHDVTRESCSVFPPPGFGVIHEGFVHHACMSAYTEAARLTRDRPGANIYALESYLEKVCEPGHTSDCVPRKIGPIEVDLYEYPPPFLLLPRAALAFTQDFFALRSIWYAAQFGLLAAAVVLIARYIGGGVGRRALWLAPLLPVAIPIMLGLQIGNFQIAALALSMLAMLLFARGRDVAGGAILGFVIVSKLFPGLLAVYLLGRGRVRAAVSTTLFGVGYTLLALVVIGARPFDHFLHYQLPHIASGAAFPWLDDGDSLPVNYSVYAMVMNLRRLGLPWVTHEISNGVASLYGLVAIGLAFVAGRRQREGIERAHEATTWLGLLTIGSLRSPFVPDAYGMVATFWLLTLLAAEPARLSARQVAALVLCAVAFSIILDNNLSPSPPRTIVVFSLARALLALGINLWAIFRPAASLQPAAAAA
jgi:hypothetical protein